MDSEKIFGRADGLCRLRVFFVNDGHFTFVEEVCVRDDDGVNPPCETWLAVQEGGLYASSEEAEADARAAMPWLQGGFD